jgi:hypothetical protein
MLQEMKRIPRPELQIQMGAFKQNNKVPITPSPRGYNSSNHFPTRANRNKNVKMTEAKAMDQVPPVIQKAPVNVA